MDIEDKIVKYFKHSILEFYELDDNEKKDKIRKEAQNKKDKLLFINPLENKYTYTPKALNLDSQFDKKSYKNLSNDEKIDSINCYYTLILNNHNQSLESIDITRKILTDSASIIDNLVTSNTKYDKMNLSKEVIESINNNKISKQYLEMYLLSNHIYQSNHNKKQNNSKWDDINNSVEKALMEHNKENNDSNKEFNKVFGKTIDYFGNQIYKNKKLYLSDKYNLMHEIHDCMNFKTGYLNDNFYDKYPEISENDLEDNDLALEDESSDDKPWEDNSQDGNKNLFEDISKHNQIIIVDDVLEVHTDKNINKTIHDYDNIYFNYYQAKLLTNKSFDEYLIKKKSRK